MSMLVKVLLKKRLSEPTLRPVYAYCQLANPKYCVFLLKVSREGKEQLQCCSDGLCFTAVSSDVFRRMCSFSKCCCSLLSLR